MSLWVYLEGEDVEVQCECECGNEHVKVERPSYFDANITHNLTRMADEAGIYEAIWRPEEIGIERARQLIEPLRKGINQMRTEPARFEQHNASNGWGMYEHFLPWLEKYLAACEEYPDANVRVSR